MGLMVRTTLTLQSSIYCENNMQCNVIIDNSEYKPFVQNEQPQGFNEDIARIRRKIWQLPQALIFTDGNVLN